MAKKRPLEVRVKNSKYFINVENYFYNLNWIESRDADLFLNYRFTKHGFTRVNNQCACKYKKIDTTNFECDLPCDLKDNRPTAKDYEKTN